MAIFDWFRRSSGQPAAWADDAVDSNNALPKFIEPTITSVPVTPGTATPRTPYWDSPSTLVGTPNINESKQLEVTALEKLPEEFGRLASWRGALILLVTSGSQFLDNVFMTSSNMALASIQKEFNVSSTNLQWMISAYTLAFGGFLLLAGSLSDR